MMKTETLKEAVAEARRFVAKAEELLKAQKLAESAYPSFGYSTPRESGAVRRSSMDLTRKLADLRAGR